ncbi:MAG: TIM barrel protein [Chloroflexota bacterium]|nr:MAG: TIM barrel protein [Chloroflexota bacterium]
MTELSFTFGTVGSPKSTPKKPGGSVGGVIHSAELGLYALELGWVRSVRVSEETCAQIKSTAEENNVAISVHAPYYINLNADEEEWPKSRKRLMDAANYGYLAGATDIIFHPGSYFGKEPEDVLPLAIKRLENCLQELRAEKNYVILRPETMGKSAMLGSLEDTLKMSQALDGVLPCIDVAHLFARSGDGSVNTYDHWCEKLAIYGKALGNDSLKNLHIHISGIDYGEKGEKEHLPLAESELAYEEFLKALNDFKCQGRILCESPILEEDALTCKQAWCMISQENCQAES